MKMRRNISIWPPRRPWRRPRRQIRLFWLIMRTFMLVIVLGIGGMLSVIGLVAWKSASDSDTQYGPPRSERMYAETLANYYVARGHSWRGVDRYLEDFTPPGPMRPPVAVVVDARSRVVASLDNDITIGQMLESPPLESGVPIIVRGNQVGTMLLWSSSFDARRHGPADGPWLLLAGECWR